MRIRVVTLTHGQPEYAALLDLLRQTPGLDDQIWADAEGRLAELDRPSTRWTVALVAGEPAAWCAARADAGVLRCHSSYERRGPGRDLGLYAQAYRVRHHEVVLPSGLPAVTYLYAQPIPLHLADGWYRTGISGTSHEPGIEPHDWWELRRDA